MTAVIVCCDFSHNKDKKGHWKEEIADRALIDVLRSISRVYFSLVLEYNGGVKLFRQATPGRGGRIPPWLLFSRN